MSHGRSGQVAWVSGQRGCRVRSCVRCEAVNTVFRGSSLSSLVVGCKVSLASRWEAVCNVFIGRSRCARLSPRRVAPMSLLLSTCPAGGGSRQQWLFVNLVSLGCSCSCRRFWCQGQQVMGGVELLEG